MGGGGGGGGGGGFGVFFPLRNVEKYSCCNFSQRYCYNQMLTS